MKKKILIVGCSFSHHVWDDKGNTIKAWPDWMKEEFSDEFHIMNLSMPGNSNEIIKRTITKKVLEEKWDFVIIQWSTIDRWDYPIQHDEHPMFVRYWPSGSNLDGIKADFYKKYYSVYGAVVDNLENILFLQQLLESENTPYTMITIGNLFSLSTTVQQIKNLMNTNGDYYGLQENVLEKMERMLTIFVNCDPVPFLLKKINYDKFTFTDDVRTPLGGGMLEWLYKEKNDYPKINWHFDGEQSYQFFNEFVKPNILIPNGLI